MPQDLTKEFKHLAQTLIDTFSRHLGILLNFDEASVKYLDGYIERGKDTLKPDDQRLINIFGAFLGECVIASYGGHWHEGEPGMWGIRFENGDMVFPFAKVAKQLAGGDGDSIYGFYELSRLVQDGTLRKDPTKHV
jgi:hypothetical protein